MATPPDPPAHGSSGGPASSRDFTETIKVSRRATAPLAEGMGQAELERECERLRAALDRSQRDFEQFASLLQHDLRKPLRGIDNLSRWIEDDLGDRMTEEAHTQMMTLRERVHRLGQLLDGAIAYARSGRPSMVLPTDVSEVIRVVVEQLAPVPPASVHPGPSVTVPLERPLFQQVIHELIGNALKHAGRPDVRVDVSAETKEGQLHVCVSDNGTGIAAPHQARVWDLFHTVSRTSDTSGVGLALVKRIVELRGGRLSLESTEHQGATFHLWWPHGAVAAPPASLR